MKKTFTILTAALMLLTMFASPMRVWGQTRTNQTAFYGFETGDAGWTATSFVTNNTAVTAHGGSKYGATNGGSSADVKYNNIVESPQSLTCYYTKTTTNTNAGSKFHIQVSSDNSTWTTVASGLGMDQVTKGTWYELTADLSSYSNVYIRVHYDGTSAVRALDDITLIYDDGATPSTDPEITFTPASITLGEVIVGNQASATFSVSQANLTSGITLSVDNGSLSTSSIAQGASATSVTWTYTPSAAGAVSATVTATSGTTTETLAISGTAIAPVEGYDVNFEYATAVYPNWTFSDITTQQSGGSQVTAHGGNYYGTTNGKTSASLTTAEKVPNPGTLTCYVTKQSGNTSSSTWYIQVSENGSTWENVSTKDAAGVTQGTWSEFTADLSSYSNVYVRIYYSGSTAIRNIDDLTLTTVTPSPAVATTTTITVPSGFNTDLYNGTNAGTLSASVTESGSGTAVSGATVTWSSSNTSVATIDNNGAVTLVAVGTTTITASYAGIEDEYRPSEGTYELTVTDSTPVTGTDVTFEAGTDTGDTSVTKDGITVSMSIMSRTDNYRCYANTDMTVTATAGKTITKVVLTCVSSNSANNFAIPTGFPGSYSYSQDNLTGTWTGSTNTVTLHASAQVRITQIVVTYETDNTPTISATPSTLDTFIYISSSTDSSAAQSVSVSGANLTDDVTVSVGNNSAFEISTTEEGTYTNNLTLTRTSGTVAATNVYVRMKAQQTGTPSGTLSISSTDATTINITLSGSVVTPMTVAEAIVAIDAATGNTVDNAYVSGVVCQIDSYNSSYHSITYWISDDGTTTTKLEVYSGKGLNNANFTSTNDLTVGDEVVVFGDLKKYNDTYEFDYNNYLVSFEHHVIPIINADNVTIAYNEEGGSIAYSISNGSGSVSAIITTGDWLELGTITNNAVPFTCSANAGNERTASITLSFNEATSKVVTITQGAYVAPPVIATYKLATSIVSGNQYIIVGENNDSYYAMGHDKGNNRNAVAISVNGTIATASIAATQNYAHEFTITSLGEGYYSIQDATAAGYLYAASSSSNYLKTENSLDADGKGDWAITFAVEDYVGVVARNTDVRNVMRFNYNSGTPLFSCYGPGSSTGTTFYLYEKVYTLDIKGYGDDQTVKNGWYLIASPVKEDITPSAENGFFTTETSQGFDLYRFNPGADKEWENWKSTENSNAHYQFPIESGRGYLYASSSNTTLQFVGTTTSNGVVKATYTGWNLIGNPLSTTATVDKDYYRMNSTNDGLISVEESEDVLLCEGIFVETTTVSEEITFTPASTGTGEKAVNNALVINLNRDDKVIDRAIVRLNSNRQLRKLTLFAGDTKIYIPQNDADYAIAAMDDNTQAFSLNFHAKTTGKYTLSLSETSNLSYIHLFDRMTGEDIDMLLEDSYSFIGSPADSEERFIVRLSYNAGISTEDTFAFQNGSDVIVNGNGELQVFDLTGRMVMNTTINGHQAVSMPQGVYVFRMIGDDVKTQKIIVR